MTPIVEVGFLPGDPKTDLTIQLKDNLQLFKDDGETVATAYIAFNKPPETIKQLLIKYDAIVTIGDPESDDVTPIDFVHFHNAVYPVRVYAVDKEGITGKKMIWQLVTEVWRIIAITASDPGGVIKYWSILVGQVEEDLNRFKPLILCRHIGIKMLFVEETEAPE